MVVDQLRERIVTGVAVAAAAVGVGAGDRDVVVSGDAYDVVVGENRPQRIYFGTEPPEVTQAVQPFGTLRAGIGDERLQRVGIAVWPTADRDAYHGAQAFAAATATRRDGPGEVTASSGRRAASTPPRWA